jgi:hypothetical protein
MFLDMETSELTRFRNIPLILTTSPFMLILKKQPPRYNKNTVALNTITLTPAEANGLENYIIVQIQEKCQFNLLTFEFFTSILKICCGSLMEPKALIAFEPILINSVCVPCDACTSYSQLSVYYVSH